MTVSATLANLIYPAFFTPVVLIAISVGGMKSNLKQILSVDGATSTFIVVETVFIAILIFICIHYLTQPRQSEAREAR